jgi:drug/metabolite transporter (DMT)-like permease
LSTEGYRHLPVMTGSLLGMLVPVLNYVVGITLFGEPLSIRSIVGSALVLGSSVVALRKNKNVCEG